MLRGGGPGPRPLSVTTDMTGTGDPVVRVGGDLDYQSAGRLRGELNRLLATSPRSMTLDLGELSFIDSTGLAILVHTWRVGAENGMPLRLRAVPRFLASILEVTGADELFRRPPLSPEADADTA